MIINREKVREQILNREAIREKTFVAEFEDNKHLMSYLQNKIDTAIQDGLFNCTIHSNEVGSGTNLTKVLQYLLYGDFSIEDCGNHIIVDLCKKNNPLQTVK